MLLISGAISESKKGGFFTNTADMEGMESL